MSRAKKILKQFNYSFYLSNKTFETNLIEAQFKNKIILELNVTQNLIHLVKRRIMSYKKEENQLAFVRKNSLNKIYSCDAIAKT